MATPPDSLDEHLRGAAPGDSLDRRVVFANVMVGLGVPAAEPPATIGRFRVVARLGSGGMGTVYEAHDPRLDRRVAIKLLHDAVDPERRLTHEAKTLARLHHPNIVAVHEIGDADGREFVAMELVDGGDLGMWLREQPRAWRDVVTRFLAAGRGLAQAHAIGIVHRDFKPENVLLARDGRVCVADFGLAGVHLRDAATAPAGGSADVVGTPAFMAPEVAEGGIATPQSDQYSFCVALREALSTTVDRPPARIDAIVRRGLMRDPAARWGDTGALCDGLARALRPRRWPVFLAVLAFVAITACAGLARDPGHSACFAEADALASVWHEVGRDATLATKDDDHPAWTASAQSLTDRVDAMVVAIGERRRALCEAESSSSPTSALVERQSACLDHVESNVSIALERWFEHDLRVMEHVHGLMPSMFDVEACDDVGLLGQEVAAPTAEDAAQQLREIRLAASRANVQSRLHEHDAARATLERALVDARALDHAPTTAMVLVELAHAANIAGEPKVAIDWLREAIVEAERGRADSIRRGALDGLARRLADVAEIDAAREALRQADAVQARSRPSETAELFAALRRGYVEHAGGNSTAALEQYTKAVELARRVGPLEIDSLYEALVGLGVLENDLHRYAAARAHFVEALDVLERLLGPDHPQLTHVLVDIAASDYLTGDLERAEAGFRRALEVRSRVTGPDDPRLAPILNNLAGIDFSQGRYREALEGFRRVLAMRERKHGIDDPDNAKFLVNIAFCLGRLDEPEEAYAVASRALELRQRKLGPRHPLTGRAHYSVGLAAVRMGDERRAREHFEQAIDIGRTVPDGVDALEPLIVLVEILLEDGDRATVTKLVEPELARCSKPDPPANECAQLEFALAQAIVGNRRTRALALAESARARLAGEDVAVAEVRAAIDAWLADHRRR